MSVKSKSGRSQWVLGGSLTSQPELNLDSAAWVRVQSLAKEIADACAPVAHWGDGNCGAVIEAVKEALTGAGLYAERAAQKPAYQKKVISQSLRTLVFERDLYRCVHCGTHKDLTVDHIHPESLGGDLSASNLQCLCRSCNSTKGVAIAPIAGGI